MNDELILLWQQGASSRPDPAEVARLAAKATMSHFDRRIRWRNLLEYGVGLLFLLLLSYLLATGDRPASTLGMIAAVCFVLGRLWWKHRTMTPLDITANARGYQTALMARLDQQISLLASARYWYVLPLYLARMGQLAGSAQERPLYSGLMWMLSTAIGLGVIWLNERVGVPYLRAARQRIEAMSGNLG